MVQPALGADLPLQPLATAEARTGPPRRSRRWRIAAPSLPHREGAKPDKRPHWPFFVPARGASRTPRRAHQPALMTAGISGSWGGAVLLPSPDSSRETGLILAGAEERAGEGGGNPQYSCRSSEPTTYIWQHPTSCSTARRLPETPQLAKQRVWSQRLPRAGAVRSRQQRQHQIFVSTQHVRESTRPAPGGRGPARHTVTDSAIAYYERQWRRP
jgi:hypothetical protein